MPQLELIKTDELIEELLDGGDTWAVISNKIIDNSRWEIHKKLIVKNKETNKFYETTYSIGATECQSQGPWEDDWKIFLTEVEPVKVEIIKYVAVK
jgi:hypothetical protein